jgi:hypothetical protein
MVTLSQGAKPGHGGILPAEKVSRVIAKTRGVPEGEVCHFAVLSQRILDAPGGIARPSPVEDAA